MTDRIVFRLFWAGIRYFPVLKIPMSVSVSKYQISVRFFG